MPDNPWLNTGRAAAYRELVATLSDEGKRNEKLETVYSFLPGTGDAMAAAEAKQNWEDAAAALEAGEKLKYIGNAMLGNLNAASALPVVPPVFSGAVRLATKARGAKRFLRGGLDAPQVGIDVYDHARKINAANPIPLDPEWDKVSNFDEALERGRDIQWIEPTLTEGNRGPNPAGRYKEKEWIGGARTRPEWKGSNEIKQFYAPEGPTVQKTKKGPISRWLRVLGNDKFANPSPSFPHGRQTVDIVGCGRGKFACVNNLPPGACYDGACYAHVLTNSKGESVVENSSKALLQSEPLVGEIRDIVAASKGGEGLARAQEEFPNYIIKEFRRNPNKKATNKWQEVSEKRQPVQNPNIDWQDPGADWKITVRPEAITQSARVTTNLDTKLIKGNDLRLGVDTDGAAWISRPDVMDALYDANPHTVQVFSSAYAPPPPPHKLAGRSIVNVTVSGWHPIPETLKRLEWARTARENGWNVILREVTADPKTWTPELADRYNRTSKLFKDSDFYIMEQPLHDSKIHGSAMNYPACCVNGDCTNCRVAEGTGKLFRDFWGIKEDAPFYTDYPNYLNEVDARDAEMLKRFGNGNY